MSLTDDLGDLAAVPVVAAPPWTPGVDIDGDGGEVRTHAFAGDTAPVWDDILGHFGLDPSDFAIVEPVRVSVWDAQVKGGKVIQMRAYRARVVRRRAHKDVDVDALVKQISRHRKRRTKVPTGTEALVVVLGDFQVGKPDGDGTRGTVDRILNAIDAVVAHVRALRKSGHGIGNLTVLGVGDMVEGCSGFYANQAFTVELDRREQVRVVRRLLVKALTTWAPLFESVDVASVAGNHGENRSSGDKGKFYTTVADNDDLAVFEQAAEVLAASEAYDHVQFNVGGNPLTKIVDIAGSRVAITHGHLARDSGSVEGKLKRWYEMQVAGQRIAPVDVLVTGHYHHLRVAQWGPTMWLQCPAMDGGSDWYAATKGDESPAGMLTFVVGADRRPNHITIL